MNPRMIVCYICGREYGSLSIDIHIPKCLEKWRNENNKLPKKERRPEPRPPQKSLPLAGQSDRQAIQEFNEAAYQAAKDANLVQCEICGRRFLPKSLAHHQKACRPGVVTFLPKPPGFSRHKKIILRKGGGSTARPSSRVESVEASRIRQFISAQKRASVSAAPITSTLLSPRAAMAGKGSVRGRGIAAPSTGMSKSMASGGGNRKVTVQEPRGSMGQGPPTVVCYICGREFGRTSIGIHERQCLDKWRTQNSQQPAHLRKEEPKKPDTALLGSRATMEQINAQAYEAFKNNLAQCERCGRRFLPDRLIVHLRSCKG
ncbi:zinc finger protein 474-like [Paramacrobiotus metropolitanus]|uniref:zinc finger protein 474-like n=1 Tax=Paramacrobiotus metropolitanus TaxID=2943436 RepID=UPI0024460C84|nr:zinc finger protein 474-like [Paramacrobiotus metropolitanus]XP_055337359.1 zinc finger protein 474-like [Paramacrobiotus metropolitanus]XP_055337360.1 zinc finger protein 474-like [Paramacrobiotus metropolitanus]XP_055337361.1 zinc finger protein 474-like [Paramacrobiotus metropolitanus]